MWTGYLEAGGIEVADGERLRANIATGPCPSGAVRPMKCNTIAEARELMGGLPPSFDRIEEAPWYDPAIPASGRLLGFDLMDGKGLGDTRRSVTALEGLGDGQTFTASRKQGREARFTVMVVALDQGALEYGRAWLSSILDGTRCGEEGGECGLFDVAWFASCPPSIEDFPAAEPTPEEPYDVNGYLTALAKGRRLMLDCSTISGPIEGELRDAGGVWFQELEFTVASELAGTYTDPSSADVSSSVGPSPIVEFFRNLIENPRGIAASGNVEVGRNLVTNPSLETNTTGWSGTGVQRVAKPSQLAGQGSWCAYGSGTSAGPDVAPRANLRTPSVAVTAGTSYPVRLGIGFGKSGPNPTTFSCSAVVEWSNGARTTLYTANNLTGTRRWASVDTRVTAPAGATSMRIFIETNAGFGDKAQVWADAVVVLSGDLANVNLYSASEVSAMPLIGAGSPVNDLTFAWAGTANASQTIIRYSSPARWVSNGATTKVARINSGGRDACLVRSPGGSGVFAGGYMALNPVVPGVEYFPSIDARGWGASMAVDGAAVRWHTSTGTFLSETVFAPGQTVTASAWSTFAGSVVAPATAARAAVVVKFPSAARRVLLSNAMLAPTQPSPFFDGDTLDTSTREYAWEGTRHASASTSMPVESAVVIDPLADPSCPPVPTPPRPPVVDESCGADVQSWSRFFYSISSSGVPGALDLIPTFTITADRVLDAARISLLPNPEGVDPDALATDPAASWVLSYLPANTPLTIDSLHREVTASVSGQALPAEHLLTGVAGQPLTWPVLTCSQGYVLMVETPYQGAGTPIQPEVSVEGRVMYR